MPEKKARPHAGAAPFTNNLCPLDARAALAHEEGQDEEHDEDEEDDLRDLHRSSRENAESENGGDQRDDEEGNGPV